MVILSRAVLVRFRMYDDREIDASISHAHEQVLRHRRVGRRIRSDTWSTIGNPANRKCASGLDSIISHGLYIYIYIYILYHEMRDMMSLHREVSPRHPQQHTEQDDAEQQASRDELLFHGQ